MEMKRNSNIDFLKGVLILFVIAGHLIPGTIRGCFPRYLIYAFHMPLFIGVSGYLIQIDSLFSSTFFQLVRKYFKRLIIPWFLAIQIYFLCQNFNQLSQPGFLKCYLAAYKYPYYHLWFILGFLAWILLSWFLLKIIGPKTPGRFLLLASIISFIFCAYSLYSFQTESNFIRQQTFSHDFHFFYYIYFVLGMVLRQYKTQIFSRINLRFRCHACVKRPGGPFLSIILTIFCSFCYIALYFTDFPVLEQVIKYLLNINLLFVLLYFCDQQSLLRCRFLEFIGKNSLAFYLYHVLGKIIAVAIAGSSASVLYGFLSILFTGIILLLISWLTKFHRINNIFFGMY